MNNKKIIYVCFIFICVLLIIISIFYNRNQSGREATIENINSDGNKFYYVDSNGNKRQSDSDTAFELYKINPEYDPTIPGL